MKIVLTTDAVSFWGCRAWRPCQGDEPKLSPVGTEETHEEARLPVLLLPKAVYHGRPDHADNRTQESEDGWWQGQYQQSRRGVLALQSASGSADEYGKDCEIGDFRTRLLPALKHA